MKPSEIDLPKGIGAPATRALVAAGYTHLAQLAAQKGFAREGKQGAEPGEGWRRPWKGLIELIHLSATRY
jgi:hypothetical protein